MYKKLIYCLFFIPLFGSCQNTNQEESIDLTAKKIIHSIKDGNIEEFINLIGTSAKNDTELREADFSKLKYYVDKYNVTDTFRITDKYTPLMKRLIEIPIFNGYDTINNIKKITLVLYFGPPDIVPLNKISGYKLLIIDTAGKKFSKLLPTTFDEQETFIP